MKRYIEAVVLGPGSPGFVQVAAGHDSERFVTVVTVDKLPRQLRLPNAEFIGVFEGRDLIGVVAPTESLGLYRHVRLVLNQSWDPIGVSGSVVDEYDGYVPDVVNLLRSDASDDVIAEHLRQIEVDRMALPGRPIDVLRQVVLRLREAKND